MSFFPGLIPRVQHSVVLGFLIALLGSSSPTAQAQGYVPAADLLPQSTAGYLRIPHFPDFCGAWERTHIGMLADDPLMKEFLDAQKERAKSYLNSIDNSIGLKPEDLGEIASGEVVGAWLPFDNDKRRPFAICLIADIRGLKNKADKVMDQIDKDLKNGAATRKDVEYGGQVIRVYTTKPKPGQLKVDEIAITFNDTRIIAADRDTVVQDILDAVAGKHKEPPLSKLAEYVKVMKVSNNLMAAPTKAGKSTLAIEWFAKPFQMGRILRRIFEVDRGNDVDILNLLERQGFDAVAALGGIVALAGERFDILHRGFVFAPTKGAFKKAAQMIELPNEPLAPIPDWVHPDTGTFNRLNWKLEQAFWASETLINEAFGDEIFGPMIEGIRDDEEGPQIDLEKDFLPYLDDQLILITDNTVPADAKSERMLVAIRISNSQKIKAAIRKAMKVEPDASELKVLPGVEIWRVQRGESDDLDKELADLGFPDEGAGDDAPPLLDQWAIAMVDAGPGSKQPYLMFSSHPELLVMVAKRIQQGANDGLGTIQAVKDVVAGMQGLGAGNVSFDRVARPAMSLRVKWELLRKGALKDSDSVLAELMRRMIEEEEGGEPDPLNARALPPLKAIQHHLPAGGSYLESVNDGWLLNGFYLK